MKLSNKQKRALEKITSRHWDSWRPEVVTAYFAYTDRGIEVSVPDDAQEELCEIMCCHKFHPIIVEMWKEDFKKGLLSPEDFLNGDLPDAYIQHALEIYASCFPSVQQYGMPSYFVTKYPDKKKAILRF